MEKYISQIEKEFDEQFHDRETWFGDDMQGIDDTKEIKFFLKQSFIKYLQSDIERWVKVFNYHNDVSNERHSTMRNVAMTEIENLKAQIKELEV